MLAYLID